MNNTKEQVSGVVTDIGDKFNGSVKVNGVWYSNKKGFKNAAKIGDQVTLELSPWEFKDKKGLNITGVSIVPKAVVTAPILPKVDTSKGVDLRPEPNKPPQSAQVNIQPVLMSTGRDFDAENRGKVRHGLTVALVPLVAQEVITTNKLKDIVTELVSFVMEGK